MDKSEWFLIAAGTIFLALGLVAMLGVLTGFKKLEGAGALLVGAGMLLHAVGRVASVSPESWLSSLGTTCVIAGVALISMISGRRRLIHRSPPSRPSQ